ncbi:MAG: glycine cleavage system aminomethyltransferase GcvT [Polyangiaceae bacterium]|nr:glycine cleavage system aminomethyltransferase GcvT [Polyangiaceae bacterium]
MTEQQSRPLALDEEHRRLGARMVAFAGWQMPIQYRGIRAEHEAVRQRAGLFDVCHMGELHLRGPRALEVTNTLLTNDVRAIADGRALYSCCCNDSGGVLDDVIAYRRSDQDVLVVCNASNREKMRDHFERMARGRCEFEDVSEATSLLALQGPQAFAVLRAAQSSIEEPGLRRFAFASGVVAGVSCTVARTGYTGEDGVEIFCAPRDVARLWSSLLEAGSALGAEPVGLGARDTLRLEACLPLYGNELTEETNPLEAGLSWVVKFDKREFLGRAALERARSSLARRLVGFEMLGRGTARHGYALLGPAGETVGFCTSGTPSPTLGKSVGLGYVPESMAPVGGRLFVDCRGKPIEAVVVPTPFYRRARSH